MAEGTRRDLLRNVVISGAAAVATALVAKEKGLFGADQKPKSLMGQTIETLKPKTLITSPVLDKKDIPYRAIPVRSNPNLSDEAIVSWTRDGYKVEDALPIYGVVYPSGSPNARLITEDGSSYGVWFKVKVPAFKRIGDSLVEDRDQDGQQKMIKGVVAGNYLREPTQEELKKAH